MRRRTVLAALAALPVAGWAGWSLHERVVAPTPVLLSEGVAVGTGGVLVAVPPDESVAYVTGTRVPAAAWVGSWPGAPSLSDEERASLVAAVGERVDGARLPVGRWNDLARGALADLVELTGPVLVTGSGPEGAGDVVRFDPGAVVAGPVGIWRYVWPRDAAFAAAAFAAVGLLDEAVAVLEHLARLQADDGFLQARYTADGVVPDGRPRQNDGPGWVLWAAGRVVACAGARADEVSVRLAALVARSTSALLRMTDTLTNLPVAGPDYWEVEERSLTLGLAAPTLLGLEAAARLLTTHGLGGGASQDQSAGAQVWPSAQDVTARADDVRAAIVRSFAPGWGRHVREDDVDAAITFVLPPFTQALSGAEKVRATARTRMARPAGGVAPGSGWRRDGVSWTPETALLAWSAAGLGWWDEAEELLSWLEVHRTACGALSEKVVADGTAAGPAPLAWTTALVLLTLVETGSV